MSVLAAVAKAVFGLLQFLQALLHWREQRRMLEAGEDRATARSLKEQLDRVEKARAARRAVQLDSLPDDDPYRRD